MAFFPVYIRPNIIGFTLVLIYLRSFPLHVFKRILQYIGEIYLVKKYQSNQTTYIERFLFFIFFFY
jgi:hypothetical protein